MAKHTPGPWIVVQATNGPKKAAAWICTVGNNSNDPAVFSTVLDGDKFVFGDKLADARLIAAAPTLAAALRDMRAAYGRLHDFLSDAIEGGRLKEADIPDDYAAIVAQLEGPCSAADDAAKKIIAEIDAL